MTERYKKRRMKWGEQLINITFGITAVEKRALELAIDEANEKTGRNDITRALILQDLIDRSPEIQRMKKVARKELNKESSNEQTTG